MFLSYLSLNYFYQDSRYRLSKKLGTVTVTLLEDCLYCYNPCFVVLVDLRSCTFVNNLRHCEHQYFIYMLLQKRLEYIQFYNNESLVFIYS